MAPHQEEMESYSKTVDYKENPIKYRLSTNFIEEFAAPTPPSFPRIDEQEVSTNERKFGAVGEGRKIAQNNFLPHHNRYACFPNVNARVDEQEVSANKCKFGAVGEGRKIVINNFLPHHNRYACFPNVNARVDEQEVSANKCKFGAVGEGRKIAQNNFLPHQNKYACFPNINARVDEQEVSTNKCKFGAVGERRKIVQNNFLPHQNKYACFPNINAQVYTPRANRTSPNEPVNRASPNNRPPLRNCCCFCYGTASEYARAHGLKIPNRDDDGIWSTHCSKKEGIAVCQKLRKIVCGICGATGDDAHTTKHHIQHEIQNNMI